ncbi:response regulator transcription factor [Leifsonia lichenia]
MGDDKGLVLVVEDESTIVDLERLYLTRSGFGVHVETEGRRALDAVSRLRPAAIVLDIGIPGLDGLELCRALRSAGDWTPIVFVTARDDEVDRILGLELGADDYLTKPFSPRELVARVRALIRRSQVRTGLEQRRIGVLFLDAGRRVVEVAGVRVELTATEFDLLDHLMSQPGRVFTREQLLSSVWGVADYSSSRTVDVHVAQLRLKLASASGLVRTVRGVGYSVAEPDA